MAFGTFNLSSLHHSHCQEMIFHDTHCGPLRGCDDGPIQGRLSSQLAHSADSGLNQRCAHAERGTALNQRTHSAESAGNSGEWVRTALIQRCIGQTACAQG